MANYYSAQYTAMYPVAAGAGAIAPVFAEPAQVGGKVLRFYAKYTTPTTGIASGSVIYMFRPPAGARVTGFGFVANSADLTNNTTLAVGTTTTADKFGTATNHGGGAAVRTELMKIAQVASYDYEFDGETDVIITTGTGATAASAISIHLEMLLSVPR